MNTQSEKAEAQKKHAKPKKTQNNTVVRRVINIILLTAWVGVVLYLCGYIVSYGVYGLCWLLRVPMPTTPVWMTLYNTLIYTLAVIIIVFIPVKVFMVWKTNRNELGFSRLLPTWSDLGLAPIGFIVYLFAAYLFLQVAAQLFPGLNLEEAQELGYDFLSSGLDRVVAFFALCIVSPIAEELIFRGWLYGKLRAKIPGKFSVVLSTLIVSILFGFMHGQWNVGLNVFVMSLVLCALREITGTIHSGIVLHILKNTVAFALLYLII